MEQTPRFEKSLHWFGDAKSAFEAFPLTVKKEMGYALHQAQNGMLSSITKMLKGKTQGAIEIISSHDGEAYRTIYTTKIAGRVYVLHAFQKKSKKGIATPKAEVAIIEERLKRVLAKFGK